MWKTFVWGKRGEGGRVSLSPGAPACSRLWTSPGNWIHAKKADYKSALRYFAGGGVKLRPWRDLLTTLRHGKARFLNALFCFAHCRTRNKKAHGRSEEHTSELQ